MTRPFTCRGFEGHVTRYPSGFFLAKVIVAGVEVASWGSSSDLAKTRVRRKLDAVERAFRERGWR